MKTKIISVLMALLLGIGSLPVTAFAYTGAENSSDETTESTESSDNEIIVSGEDNEDETAAEEETHQWNRSRDHR